MDQLLTTGMLGNGFVGLLVIGLVAWATPSNTEADKDDMKVNNERIWK